MATALDAPESVLDPQERDFVAIVREHGWHRMNVFPDEEGDAPGFSYTTGFWLGFEAPEVVVFGLSSEVAGSILWDLYRELENGVRFEAGVRVPGLIQNMDVVFAPVARSHYRERLGWTSWFYGGEIFPSLQLIWPDRAGLFPWEAGADPAFARFQPDLSESGWAALVKPQA